MAACLASFELTSKHSQGLSRRRNQMSRRTILAILALICLLRPRGEHAAFYIVSDYFHLTSCLHESVGTSAQSASDVAALTVFPYCVCSTYACSAGPYSFLYIGSTTTGTVTNLNFQITQVLICQISCCIFGAYHPMTPLPCIIVSHHS